MSRAKVVRVVGFVLHVLIGVVMLMAGAGKVLGIAPEEVAEQLAESGLGDQIRLIGIGEMVTAALLLIPRTLSLGILLVSGFWGGAIVTHMSAGETYAPQAAFLVASWVGAWMRLPTLLSSFRAPVAVEGPPAPAG